MRIWQRRTIFCIAVLCLLTAGSAFGAEITFSLENGMKVVVKENHVAPIVAVQVWVKAGSTTEIPTIAGISHLLEHMAFKGTKKRGVGEIAREVESLGGSINAYTTFDHTVYHITISSRYVNQALEILADTLGNSVFDEAELKKEIEVVMEEYRMNQDDPGRMVSKSLFSRFYERHPYGRPVIGYPETLSKITRDEVVSYFHNYYVPNNMVLVVVGDVEREAVRPVVQEFFGPLMPKGIPPKERPREPGKRSVGVVVKKMDTKRAHLDIAFPGVSLTDPDVYPYDLVSLILGQGRTSRLYRRVKDELRLVDSIYAYSFTPKDPGLLLIGSTLEPENVREAIRAMLEEIYRVASFGVSGSELERARKNTISDFVYSLESQSSLARLLGFYETVLGDPFFQEEYTDNVRRVSREDIQAVSQKYFKKDNLVLSLVLPRDFTGDITEEEVGTIARESFEKFNSREEEDEPGIAAVTLSNGIRVVTRENRSVPVVAVSIGFLGGVRAETPAVNGISNIMSYMLTRGTKRQNSKELAEMIEDMAGSIEAFSGRNSFGISGKFLSEDFEKCMQLMSEMILAPTFGEGEMDKKKKEVLAAIKARQDSPTQEVIRLYLKSQYGSHPYSLDPLGTEESVSAVSRDDLVEFYDRLVFPENMVIVVSGDIDGEHAIKVVSTAFEDFSRDGDRTLAEKKEVSQLEKALTVKMKREKLQAHFVIGFLGTTFSNGDRYPLEVLSSALAGQGGRLFKELRDEKSLAYSLTAFSAEQYDRGFLAFYMGTAADKLVEAKDSMWDEIVKFLKEGISDEEMERAKSYIIGNFEIGLQSNGAYASSLLFNVLYGAGIEGFLEYPERIKMVTKEQVMEAARKYINLDRYVLAIISP